MNIDLVNLNPFVGALVIYFEFFGIAMSVLLLAVLIRNALKK